MILSVVLVNYNTFELTCKAIESLLASEVDINLEIILVDNNSNEDKRDDFLKRFPKIIYIQNRKNEGFGRANNIGMAEATGNFILLINSDTEVKPNTLQLALDGLISTNADLYSCAQFMENGAPFFNEFNSFYFGHSLKGVWYSMPFFHIEFLKPKILDNKAVTKTIRVKTVSGAFMLLKRKVYEETNGFDPDFFLYSEETEWCYNRIKNRFKLIYDPNNSFIHKVGKSSNANMEDQQFISKSLGFYKRGYLQYLMYIIMLYFLVLPTNIIFYFISKKQYKKAYIDVCKKIVRLSKYLLWRIPSEPNGFGARKQFLILDSLKS